MNSLGGGSGSIGSLGGIISIGLIIYGLFAGNEKESGKPEEKIELSNYDRTAPIPLIYGTDKVTGTCIYLNNINVDKVVYGGKGFGGPETIVWMYYADFAMGFGEGTISEYLDYKIGESGSNPGGQLSVEEFLGSPDQLKSTIIDLNYGVRNTAYLAFSGCIGTSNVLPNITAIIAGIDTALEEDYEMHWDTLDPMTYVFDNLIGHYFADDNYIYWIDERDGSIYLYNDINNTKTLIGAAGEFSTNFQNFSTYKTEDGIVYCFSNKNVANVAATPYGMEFHYSYFYIQNGVFYSIKLDEVIQCNYFPEIRGYGVTSIVGDRAYINVVPAQLGTFGRFICWCNGGSRTVFGGASCEIGWDSTALKYYVDLNFYTNKDNLLLRPTSIESVHIYFESIFAYTEIFGTLLNYVHISGIIVIGDILYVFGKNYGGNSKEAVFVEKFNSQTGERENNIFRILVFSAEGYYRMNANISGTNLGDEVAITCNGTTEDKASYHYSQYKFFIQGNNINTFVGYLNTGFSNPNLIMVLGCKKFNNVYFLLYMKMFIDGTTTHKEYLVSFNDDLLGFMGWNFLYSTEIWNITLNIQPYTYCFQLTSSRGPNSNLDIYNDRLYFKSINLLTYNGYERFYYLTKSGIVVDDQKQSNFPTTTGFTYSDPYYLISCRQRAINANKNSITSSNYPTRVLDYKPSIATPISVLYDFLTNTRYGMGLTNVDGPLTDLTTTFGSEHEYCLGIVNTENSWDYRFLFAKAFTSKQKGYDIIKDILKTCRGFIYFCDGKIKVHIEKPDEEPVIYFGYHKETLASGPY